ncbi:hypothetical protein Bca4012_056443 [Brassica carinata]|uniref:PWI domain-containing protein n=1 Tax=Brassica carinata TaxID=52824 RepID=A0A8X8B3Q0_BRACI|nr:hypothetical protein Bca52824_013726 [Brassica carinata]
MASKDLKTWVSDKLMVLLGYSERSVVNYLIKKAELSKSPAEVVRVLMDYGIASSGDTRSFAEEIFAKVPHKTAGVNLYQQREAEAAMLVRKQQTYALIDDDDDEDEVVKEKKPSASESRKSDKGKKRFRKKSGQSDDSEEEVPVREDNRNVRRKVSEDEDDGSESEEERVRDQKEKEELEQHIRDRDTARTRKVTEQKLSKKEQEEALRRENALEKGDLNPLRNDLVEGYFVLSLLLIPFVGSNAGKSQGKNI